MAIYEVMERGQHATNKAGAPMFMVRVYDKHLGKQVNRRVAGKDAAAAAEADLMAAVKIPLESRRATEDVVAAGKRQGRQVITTTTKITVRQWSAQYLEHYKRRTDGTARPFSSWDHDRRCLEIYVLPEIGDRTLESLRLAELDDLVAGLTKRDGTTPLSGATKESVAGTIKRMWKMAERRDVLDVNRAAGLSTAWGGKSEARAAVVPSLEDVYRLSGCAEEQAEGYGDIVQLAAFTGMRWEEFNAVRVDDVDWDDHSILVHWTATFSGGRRFLVQQTKSEAGRRRVPIAAQLEAPLARLISLGNERREQHGEPEERLVVTNTLGGALHYNTWRKALDKARVASGVTYTAHVLRHVAASLAIRSGMSDVEVADMMGHANVAYTRKIYGHLFPTDGRVVANRMSSVIDEVMAQEKELAKRRKQLASRS